MTYTKLQIIYFYRPHRLTLTKLQVEPAQVDFRFQEKTNLQFEIKELNFELQQVYVQLQHCRYS